jgi:hypothetical protein
MNRVKRKARTPLTGVAELETFFDQLLLSLLVSRFSSSAVASVFKNQKG